MTSHMPEGNYTSTGGIKTAPSHLRNTEGATSHADVRAPAGPPVTGPADRHGSVAAGIALAVLRIAIGFVFLWAFLDKLFGLGYSTPDARAWISGGSPTEGFLSHVDVGPLQGFFTSIAGAWWADWLFMLGLAGIGAAMILGIGTRIAAIAGTAMMLLMWLAEFPIARFTDGGDPTGSTNPIVDYHIIYALALIVAATTAARVTLGMGRRWAALPVVQRHPWLK